MPKRKFLGEFENLVLLAVARMSGRGYGMAIRREIEERTEREVSIGAIYVTLERLEGKGYIISHTGDPTPERGGRVRRHFAVTPAGTEALHRSREMLDRMWDGVELDGAGQEVA